MIITHLDKRNIQVAMDIVQAKCLVHLLRNVAASQVYAEELRNAALEMEEEGFIVDVTDMLSAAVSFVAVVQRETDQAEADDRLKAMPSSKGVQ